MGSCWKIEIIRIIKKILFISNPMPFLEATIPQFPLAYWEDIIRNSQKCQDNLICQKNGRCPLFF